MYIIITLIFCPLKTEEDDEENSESVGNHFFLGRVEFKQRIKRFMDYLMLDKVLFL